MARHNHEPTSTTITTDLDPLTHLTTTRYLRGRPATANPNPRGKHHRNPLPWSRRKLSTIADYQDDAAAYKRHVWKEQQQQQANGPVTKSPKPNKPHFLTYLEANAKRNRSVWYRCSCCYDLTRVQPGKDWRRAWPAVRDEGREMARSRLAGPGGDEQRRSEWFRGVRIIGVASCVNEGVVLGGSAFGEEAGENEAEGYELGPGFGLEDILRDEPVYRVRYKYGPVRRSGVGGMVMGAGRGWDGRSTGGGESDEDWEWDFVDRGWETGGERERDDLGSEWTGIDDDDWEE